jgi:hypothetical protein
VGVDSRCSIREVSELTDSCTTANMKNDNSNYWVPQLYHKNDNNTYSIDVLNAANT